MSQTRISLFLTLTCVASSFAGMSAQVSADTVPSAPAPYNRLIEKHTDATSAISRFEQEAFSANPASMFYLMPYTLSDFRLDGQWLHQEQPTVVQKGTGHLLGNVDAHSYMRLNRSTVVWGTARFTTGQYRGIKWNNSMDYELVSPYIMGDSVGGNLSSRQYSFSGGYAGTLKGWTWGAQASYTAAISYRNRDPRDKIVVSDLEIRGGATRLLASRWILGLGASLRVYNQECDLTFMNPLNETRTYLLTGLGNYYSRFSGISDQNTAYTGIGYSGTIQLLPASGTGFSISATVGNQSMRQVLRSFNNLDLTRSNTLTALLRTSYTLRVGSVSTGVLLSADILRRNGDENIFGSSTGNNYEKIGSRRNYTADSWEGTLAVPVDFSPSASVTLRFLPGVKGSYTSEKYHSPLRETAANSLSPMLRASLLWRSSRQLQWQIDLMGEQRIASADKCNLAGLNTTTSSLGASVVHNFEMLTADATTAGANASAVWQFNPTMALRISAGYTRIKFQNHGISEGAQAIVAMIF